MRNSRHREKQGLTTEQASNIIINFADGICQPIDQEQKKLAHGKRPNVSKLITIEWILRENRSEMKAQG